MRTALAILWAATAYGTPASARAAAARPVLDVQALPAQCRAVAAVPASAQIQLPAFAAKISAADCEDMVALGEAKGPSTDAKALEASVAPSLALLDDAIANGDLESQIVATFAKADLLVGLDVYLAGSVARVGTMAGSDLAEYLRQIDQAHALASPWRTRGVAAYRDLDRLLQTSGGRELAGSNSVIMAIASRATAAPIR